MKTSPRPPVRIPPALANRPRSSPLGMAPPAHWRKYAYPLGQGKFGLAVGRVIKGTASDSKLYARFTITTIDRDAVGDEVIPEGRDGARYALNPVWLFSHAGNALPIGMAWREPGGAIDVKVFPGSHIESGIYFAQSNPDAIQCYAGVKEGWLNAASIGFNPLVDPVTLQGGGYGYPRWEHIETSLCSTPANPFATVIRSHLAKGKIAGERISPAMRKALEPLAERARPLVASGFRAKRKAPPKETQLDLDAILKALRKIEKPRHPPTPRGK